MKQSFSASAEQRLHPINRLFQKTLEDGPVQTDHPKIIIQLFRNFWSPNCMRLCGDFIIEQRISVYNNIIIIQIILYSENEYTNLIQSIDWLVSDETAESDINIWKHFVVLEGQHFQMTSSKDSQWFYWAVDAKQTDRSSIPEKTSLSNGGCYIIRGDDETVVHVPSAQMSDAGTYLCFSREPNSGNIGFNSKKVFNQLFVIGK